MAETEKPNKRCMEMERFNGKAKEDDQGALALVLDLAKAFGRVSLLVVWAWATHSSFTRKILRVLCGNFEHQRRVQFEGCAAEPLTTITAILPRSKWTCLLLQRMRYMMLHKFTFRRS